MRVRHWAPSSPENATGFFATTAAIHHAVAGLPTLAPVLARFGGDTTADFVARFVSDPTLSAVLGGWAAYFGYGAHRIAAVAIAEFTEACFDGGVLQPEGGITALTDALRGVIGSSGGLVLLSAPVAEAPVSLGVPTVLNPVLAPDGHHIALLYTFTTAERTAALAADPDAAERYADQIVAAAERGLPGLRDSVVTRAVSVGAVRSIYPGTGGALGWAPTPETLIGSRRTAQLLRGRVGGATAAAVTRALPGLVSGLAARVLPGVTTALDGVYCVGQWTSTGAGINNVCRSAALVADHVAG